MPVTISAAAFKGIYSSPPPLSDIGYKDNNVIQQTKNLHQLYRNTLLHQPKDKNNQLTPLSETYG